MSAPSVPGVRPPSSGITRLVPRIPLRRRVGRAVRGAWPAIAWVLAACAAVWLYLLDGWRGRLPAVVEAEQVEVGSTLSGRVECVLVVPGQAVQEGQVVARLGASDARGRLDLAIAELERIEAEIPAQAQEWRIAAREALFDAERMRLDVEQTGRSEDAASRGFANDVESIEDRIVVVEGALASGRARLRQVDAELSRLRKLGAEAVSALKIDVLQARHDTTARAIESNELRLALLRRQREAVVARQQGWEARTAIDFAPVSPILADEGIHLAPLVAGLRAQEERVRQARAEIEALTLRAPTDGHVGAVLLHPGEVALAGVPVVSIVTSRPGRFVAFIPEAESAAVRMGEEVLIRPTNRQADPVRGRVVGLGASIVEASLRFRPTPTTPVWGREVYLEADGAPAFVAGEACRIAFVR